MYFDNLGPGGGAPNERFGALITRDFGSLDAMLAELKAGGMAGRGWAWVAYDWANSAYVTTTLTVLMAPYLTVIAKKAACPTLPGDVACPTNLHVIGIPIAPGSLVFYVLTVSTIVSAIVLIFIGAIAVEDQHA